MTYVNSNKDPLSCFKKHTILVTLLVSRHPGHCQESNTGSFGIDLLQRRLASFFVINTSLLFFLFFFFLHA